ncbi:MAG: hypothetical protein J6O04_11130 [Selenomonadaceae bacterium]|nr:hypothetical protein [Selenomonadaceae bacterium]
MKVAKSTLASIVGLSQDTDVKPSDIKAMGVPVATDALRYVATEKEGATAEQALKASQMEKNPDEHKDYYKR